MKRIILMVLYNIPFVPYWWWQLCHYAKKADHYSEEERYALLKKITVHANKGGRVKIDAHGVENLPDKNGFILYPNHQGMFDVLAFVESCPKPFSVVMKKEVENVMFLKQVFHIMKAKALDRSDIRQGMKVIAEVSKEVGEGRNYLIFAEGTRSKEGNKVLDFKGGSFKAAMKAKCPIVPVAVIDAYKGFDTNSIQPITVQLHYLPPIYYEEYKNMKSTEVAEIVKNRIKETIEKNIKKDVDK